MSLARFATAYALYAAVLLIYAHRALTDSPEALFAPSAPALTVLTATALALPILDVRWGVLRPRRVRRTMAVVFIIGALAEVTVRGDFSVATLLSATVRLIIYLIVLAIAVMLYLMLYPRRSASDRNDNVTKHYTF